MRLRERTAATALVLSAVLAGGAAFAEPVTITFLHTNDVYEISPKDGKGGLGPLKTLLDRERAANPNTITTFGGDLISPSLMSGVTKGAQMIDLYNDLGTDVAVAGNHEFDFGPEVAAQRMGESKFPWLAANVLGKDGNVLKPMQGTALIEKGGYKIGFLGLLTADTIDLSSPGYETRFAPVPAAAAAAVEALKGQGADLIVALTHQDLADDRLLLQSVPGIDIALGGHDHDAITFYEGGKLLVKAGSDAHFLAAVDITLDRVMKKDKEVVVWAPGWRFVPTAGVTPEPTIQAKIDGYNAKLDAELGQPVGTTAVALDSTRESVRTRESNMGNLIADAIRETVGADVAIVNGGGIRGDKVYDAGTTLTRKDVLSELPFGNVTVLLEINGADLLAALENGVSQVEDKAGRFPQVSGMTYTYDAARPAGSRIVKVEIGGAPLDPAKVYKLAANDYIFGGGDGYAPLTRTIALIDPSGAKLMASQVMDWIAAKGSVAPAVEGRITRLN
ncbi:MAG: 5'-nucleotidase C-terminal domain-containing protein [Geminicoccaceae bacterium]